MSKFDYEPCPWCGRNDMETENSGRWGHFVRCPHCNVAGPNRRTADGARDAWNARAEPVQGRLI